jgi:RNA polymerase sigma factor (sigma-70 family)
MTGGGESEIERAIRGAAPRGRDDAESRREDADTADLVARIQGGELELFSGLYERYFDRIYAYLRVLLRNAHEAEDATQQVFMQAFEALPRYRPHHPFRAWLFTIARNRGMDEYRKRERLEIRDPNAIEQSLEHEAPGGELPVLEWISDQDLLLFIERLPLPQRQALLMRYLLDLTNVEIGAAMGRSAEDVRKLHHRALRFLESRLVAIGREPPRGRKIRMRRWSKQATVLRRRRFALMR